MSATCLLSSSTWLRSGTAWVEFNNRVNSSDSGDSCGLIKAASSRAFQLGAILVGVELGLSSCGVGHAADFCSSTEVDLWRQISFVVSVGGPRTSTTRVVFTSGDLSFGFSPDGLGSLYTLGTYHLVAVWVG